MLQLFVDLAANAGMPFENIVLLIVWLGGIIFVAKDFRIASIYWLVSSGVSFLWFYTMYSNGQNIDYTLALILMFISLIIMAMNLLFIKQNSSPVV